MKLEMLESHRKRLSLKCLNFVKNYFLNIKLPYAHVQYVKNVYTECQSLSQNAITIMTLLLKKLRKAGVPD